MKKKNKAKEILDNIKSLMGIKDYKNHPEDMKKEPPLKVGDIKDLNILRDRWPTGGFDD